MQSITNQINALESEISWFDKSLEVSNLPKLYHVMYVNINGITIKILLNDSSLIPSIYKKFIVIEAPESDDNVPIYCFHNGNRSMPYNGYIDRERNIMEVFGMGFGIFKSELNGFATAMCHGLPVHAAGLSTERIGSNLLVAGRNGGKSTAVLNLMYLCQSDTNKILLSDDWILLEREKLIGIDPTLSLEPDNISDNPHISWLKKYKFINSKISINIHPNGIDGFMSGVIPIERIVLLTQGMTRLITEVNNPDQVAEFIIKATYHFPYNGPLIEKHMDQWARELSNRQILVFDRSHASSKMNGFDQLIGEMSNTPVSKVS